MDAGASLGESLRKLAVCKPHPFLHTSASLRAKRKYAGKGVACETNA